MVILNSFRCCTKGTFYQLQIEQLYQMHLVVVDNFSYMLEKFVIRSFMVFSFTVLCATNFDKVNQITPSTCLSRRVHSSSFIVTNFFPRKGKCNFFPSSICIIQNPKYVWSNFLILDAFLPSPTIAPTKTFALIPVVRNLTKFLNL